MATVTAAERVLLHEDATPATVTDNQDRVRLICSVHPRAEWCDHIAMVVSPKAPDARQIGAIGDDWTPVTIPLAPTIDVWGQVRVAAMHHGGMHEVTVSVWGSGKIEHIGVLAEGEGRYAIRGMLYDWLRYKYVDAPRCTVRTHGLGGPINFGRAAELPRTDNPTQELLNHTYSILTTGACLSCVEYLDTTGDVPAVE